MPTNPNALVSTDWVADHLDDQDVVVIDVDEDIEAYSRNHIPGSIGLDWKADLQDPLRRTFVDSEGFARLMDANGITSDTQVILYGGNNNWFAAYAYWYFKIYGHREVALMDGGRKKWEQEGRDLVTDVPTPAPSTGYKPAEPDPDIRSRREQILAEFVGAPEGTALVDVRSPAEFSGESTAPPHLPGEAAMVPGHIPGATNIPWSSAVDTDTGEFLPADQLHELYASNGVSSDEEIIAYCRIGERAAHTWFVLHEILGFDRVRNYDGSWTEYGSLVDVPVER